MDDIQVLFGLRHDAVVGGDGKKDQVDAVGAGEHIFDEPLMPGNIDDAGLRAVRQVEMREPQIDGDTAFLFFLKPVRVLSGQRFDQAGFSMIDVAGGADDVGHTKFGSTFKVQGAPFAQFKVSRSSVGKRDIEP